MECTNPFLADDLVLMSTYADVLFTYDRRRRMLSSNEPREEERHPAPRLYLGYTISGYILRLGATLPDALVRRVEEIVDRESPVGDLQAQPLALTELREVLEQHGPIAQAGGGPVYRFPEPVARLGGAVELTDANVELARDTYPWLLDQLADWGPCFAVVRDGAVVSVCFSARVGTKAMAAGVDSLPAFRGRGYAAVVTAAWGAAIRGSGRIPIYSTAWDNRASQRVARRLGLIMVGADATLGAELQAWARDTSCCASINESDVVHSPHHPFVPLLDQGPDAHGLLVNVWVASGGNDGIQFGKLEILDLFERSHLMGVVASASGVGEEPVGFVDLR